MILKLSLGGVVAKAMTALVAGAFMFMLTGAAEAVPSKQRGFVGLGEFGGTYVGEDNQHNTEIPNPYGWFSLGYIGDYFFGAGNTQHAFAVDASFIQRVAEVEGGDNDALTMISAVPGYRYHFSGADVAGGYVGGGLLLRSLDGLQITYAATGGYEWQVDFEEASLFMGIHLFYAPRLDYDRVENVGSDLFPPMIAYSVGVPLE